MTHHPCGALPVHTISAHAWYCEHHMAWWASVSRHHEDEDGHLEITGQHAREFGPFDSGADARDFILRWISEWTVDSPPPDAPWDRRQEPRST